MEQEKKVIYTGKAHTIGGRDGTSNSDDGRLQLKLSTPGAPGTGTNPEQLFAAGWSACFLGALAIAARKMKVALPLDTADDLEIDLCRGEDGFTLEARHKVSLPGLEGSLAQELVNAAHETCPYSKATRGNIKVTLNVV